MRLTTQGIVLRETNYKEADKILTVLTSEFGKRTVKSRACRRKNSRLTAGSQLLVYSDLTLHQRGEYLTLSEADPLAQFWSLRQDLERLALASYFAEVTEHCAQEGEACGDLLSLLLNCLYALDKLDKPLVQVKAAFELRLLCLMGYEPLLEGCAICGREDPADPVLDPVQGLLRCRDCGGSGGRPLCRDSLAALRHIIYGHPKRLYSFRLGEDSLRRLTAASEAFLYAQLERTFGALDFYKTLL